MISLSSADGACLARTLRIRIRQAMRSRLLLPCVLLASCISTTQTAGQVAQPDAQSRSIRGTVINSATQAPVGRALVFSPDNRFAMLTDGGGHFEFALPKIDSLADNSFGFENQPMPRPNGGEASPVSLMARKPGFLDDPNERNQFEAIPGSELTIPLMPEALITGRVIFSASEPANGVSVQIFSRQVQDGLPRWVQRSQTQTNSNGEFRFAELPPGPYKLLTREWTDNDPTGTLPGGELHGFPPVYYPGVPDFGAAGTIQLLAGQSFHADVSLVRQPYYPVTIPVLNAEQNVGMNITVSVQGHPGPGYSLGYNPTKQTIVGQLPSGNYLVEATTYGQNSAAGAVSIAVAGAAVEGPSMALTPNASIRLNVTEQFTSKDGESVTTGSIGGRSFRIHGPRSYLNANVEAVDEFAPQRNAGLRPFTGQNDDALVLENLAAGKYWLRLHSNLGYVASATMSGVDLLREPLVVTAGSNSQIEITVRDDTAEIEGTVAGLTPEPNGASGLASASPVAWRPSATVYCVPLPDAPGEFQQFGLSMTPTETTFSGQIPPGAYRILAFKTEQRNLPYRDAESMKAYESKGQVVHLTAGQKTTVQLQIISGSE